MTIRILTIAVILCILFGSGCTNEKPEYDAGLAAYERGHYRVAMSDFESRAMKGDSVAQFCLGFMYKHGEGVIANEDTAEEWYTKAADQDYAPAQSSLFFVYSASDQYSEKALRLVFKAAQQGEAWGQFILAVKFQNGDGVPQDDKEAYYWYRLALENKGGLANPARPKAQQDKSLAAIFKWSGEVERKLSEDQKEEIQKRVANWKPRILVGSGTGFYIDKNHILTNAHVARLYLPNSDTSHRYDEVRVRYRYVEEKPGSVDWQVDLALLYDDSPPPRGNTAAAIFRRTPVDFGEPIAVFGYPLSLNQLSYRGNGTSGIVSGLAGATIYLYPKNFFQFTAPVQSGNSGGPVFDRAGHVVGVVVSQLSSFLELKDGKIKIVDGRGEVVDRQNINFAIKFDVVEKFLNDKNGITPASEGSDTTKDLDSTQIFKKARKFTVPVLCFLNKGEDPLPVVEMSINDINN